MAGDDIELTDIAVRLPRALVEEIVLNACPPPGDRTSRRNRLAKWILAARRRRATMLPRMRFGEPTWEMILELYVAELEGSRIDVSGLCLSSGVAPTTAWRYVDLLADDGLIFRVADDRDGRRAFVVMSDTLRASIDEWLNQADQHRPRADRFAELAVAAARVVDDRLKRVGLPQLALRPLVPAADGNEGVGLPEIGERRMLVLRSFRDVPYRRVVGAIADQDEREAPE